MYTPNLSAIEKLISEGYPKKIIGNGGYTATLVDKQPLNKWEHLGIYQYPGGVCVHSLEEAKSFPQFHDEIVVRLYNPVKDSVRNTDIEYVGIWFSDNPALSPKCDACIGYELYDSDRKEIDGGEYEYASSMDYWTIETTIDVIIEFALEKTGKAYESVSYSVYDFENDLEAEY